MTRSRFTGIGLAAIASVAIAQGHAYAASYTVGDVFASVSNGLVNEYTPTGTLVQTLNTGDFGFTTGSAFDSAGNFYVTAFSAGDLAKFDNNGALVNGAFISGLPTPEDVLTDSAGHIWVSATGGGLREYDSAGNLLNTYAANQRIDWFDLNSTETTMLYTTEGGFVGSWDLTTNTANPNFSNAGGDYALRILGDGSVLVADASQIDRFDAAGNIIQSYDTGANNAWFALNLDPDGTTFWSGSFDTSNVCRFNIASGALVNCFNTNTGGGTLYGLSVFGEITQVGGSDVPEPASLTLLGTGALGLVARYRRRRNAKK